MSNLPQDATIPEIRSELDFVRAVLETIDPSGPGAGRRIIECENEISALEDQLSRAEFDLWEDGPAQQYHIDSPYDYDEEDLSSRHAGMGHQHFPSQLDGGMSDEEQGRGLGSVPGDRSDAPRTNRAGEIDTAASHGIPFSSPSTLSRNSVSDSSNSLVDLPTRKRPRDSTGSFSNQFDRYQGKSRRTTPSPQQTTTTTPSSFSSLGVPPEDLQIAKEAIGSTKKSDLLEFFEQQKLGEKAARDQREQELRDAEFARSFQTYQSPLSSPPRNSLPSYPNYHNTSFQPSRDEASASIPSLSAANDLHNSPSIKTQSGVYNPMPESDYHSAPTRTPSYQMPGSYVDNGSDDDIQEIGRDAFQSHRQIPGSGAPIRERRNHSHNVQEPSQEPTSDFDRLQTLQRQRPASFGLPSSSSWGSFPNHNPPPAYLNSSNFSPLVPASSNGYNGILGTGAHALGRPSLYQNPGSSPFPKTESSAFDLNNTDWGFLDDIKPFNSSSGAGQPGYSSSRMADPYSYPYGGAPYGYRQPTTANEAAYYDYVTNDPTKNREEIKSLLENIKPDVELPPADREGTPEAMKYRLMEHQKLGLTWLKTMEEGSNKGGILADDMGLGKTIQALALIVTRPSTDPKQKTTLIVAPVALMKQWEREIRVKVKDGHHRLSTYLLHGSKRNASWSTLCVHDVVLTTFGTLASEYKKMEGWAMRKRANPGISPTEAPNMPLLSEKSKWYRVIIDEAQCIKNRNTKSALGACALKSHTRFCLTGTPMMNNVSELHSLIEFLRIKPYNELKRFNQDFAMPLKRAYQASRDQAMKKLQALLKAVLLRRTKKSTIDGTPIIQLPERSDETVHAIFDEDQQAFYNALETQTQLQFNKYVKQNSIGRNYSNVLVLLLRLRQACCHPHLIQDFAQDSLNNADVTADGMLELARQLAPDVISRIKATEAFECPVCYDAVQNPAIFIPCGHDTCSECFTQISTQTGILGLAQGNETSDIKCPKCRGKITTSKIIDYLTFKKVHMLQGSPIEDQIQDESEDEDEAEDESNDEEGSLRDFIDDGDEEVDKKDKDNWDALLELTQSADGDNRPEQSEETRKRKSTQKAKKAKKGKGKAEPVKTLAQLKKDGMRNAEARARYMRRLDRGWIPSAKVEKCCEILENIQLNPEGEKTIVFSQFTSLLDLLEVPLARKGWVFKRYDGSMTSIQRNNAILEFSDKPSCRIMLVSLKAGNAGLNLVAASQVIILDPFWNPFIEEQAIDRTHRIGQMRPVKVHRILVNETVEDRIISLQRKKRDLIEGALDEKASESIGRLNNRELAFLFGVDGR
ncbi:MAG: hypothetical protein M1837_000585 [Sclerophora amabilis]|nr:MAG: hypothetical protein M1837_000585 [Sclerophora amabilis]